MNFRKNAFKVGIGTIIAQLISGATLLAIPHLYNPDDFGKYTSVLVLSTIFLPFATLKIEVLSTVIKSNLDSRFLFWFVKRLAFSVSCFSILITFPYFKYIIGLGVISAINFSLTTSFMVIAQSFAIIQVQMQIRDQNLDRVAISGVIQNGTTLIFQTVFTFFSKGSSGLILGYLLGRAAAVYTLRGKKFDLFRYKFNQQKIQTLTNLILPGKSLFFASVLDGISLALPVLYTAEFFRSEDVGKVGLLQSIMLVPVSLAGIVISSTLFSNAESIRNRGYKGSQEWFNENLGSLHRYFMVVFSVTSIALLPVLFQNFYNENWKIQPQLIVASTMNTIGSLILLPLTNRLILFGYFSKVRVLSSVRFSVAIFTFFVCHLLKIDWILSISVFFLMQSGMSYGIYLYSRSRL
jgi:hypothetical protein